MAGVLCSMVGASFVTAVAEVIRRKKGITAVGNAQVDTAQSKFGGASALFDGTGDRLTVNSTGDFGFSGDFTLEGWLRANSFNNQFFLFDFRLSTDGSVVKPTLYYTPSSGGSIRYFVNGSDRIQSTAFASTTNTWYHIALCKSGTSTKLFINGTQDGSTYTDTNTYVNSNCEIGDYAGGGYSFNGYMDEIRFSNSARYTANFSVATAPFVNDANTLLLIHADGTDAVTYFEDDNGVRAPKGIIANGNAQVDTAQSQFGGASALFDNAGDWLEVQPINDLAFGTGNFTIEFWIRFADTGGAVIWDTRPIGTNGAYTCIYVGSSTIIYYFNNANRIQSSSYTTNVWYHVAVVRSGSETKMYLNGTQTGSTYTDSSSVIVSSRARIGRESDSDSAGAFHNGWIDEVRVSNIARYTANFSVATAPFVNDANTLLLIHADGTDASTVFRDDNGVGRAARGIQAIGNAQVDTAQSQFGGTSLLLDGSGDYLTVNPFTGIAPGTGDFTFEAWIRLPNNNVDYGIFGHDGFNGDFQIRRVNDGTVRLGRDDVAWDLTSSVVSIANTWAHIAVCRTGTTARIFVNGTQVASGSNSINYVLTNTFRIGSGANMGANDFNGWIDEVRISNIGRYTAAFTPSTTPFQNDANTLLLLHMDGTDASTVFVDDNGKTPT